MVRDESLKDNDLNDLLSGEQKKNEQIEELKEFQAKREAILDPSPDAILDEYMELTKQFGYVMFFSSAFPLAGLLSIICNYFEMA